MNSPNRTPKAFAIDFRALTLLADKLYKDLERTGMSTAAVPVFMALVARAQAHCSGDSIERVCEIVCLFANQLKDGKPLTTRGE